MSLADRVARDKNASMVTALPEEIASVIARYEYLLRHPQDWREGQDAPQLDRSEIPFPVSDELTWHGHDDLLAISPEAASRSLDAALNLVTEQLPWFKDQESRDGRGEVDFARSLVDIMNEPDRHVDGLIVLYTLQRKLRHLRCVSERVQFLHRLIRFQAPRSERAAKYVRMATELYLWGFNVQCVVFCAAAVESSLARHLHDIGKIDPDKRVPDFAKLINLAFNSAPPQKEADALRELRNKSLHPSRMLKEAEEEIRLGTPASTAPDAEAALAALVAVLDAIWPWQPPPAHTKPD
jgi:hypothetical protein